MFASCNQGTTILTAPFGLFSEERQYKVVEPAVDCLFVDKRSDGRCLIFILSVRFNMNEMLRR